MMTEMTSTVEPELRAGFRSPARDGVGVYLVGDRAHECPRRVLNWSAGQIGGFSWILNPEAWNLELGRHGLLWVGAKHYPLPHQYLAEATKIGVRRRIPNPPKELVLGQTRVYLAHSKAILNEHTRQYLSGIFAFFIPMGIDLVVGKTVPERALKMAERIGERCRIVSVADGQERQLELFR